MITVIRVGGVGERPDHPMLLNGVTDRLDRSRFRTVDVPLSVQYGPVGTDSPFGHSFDRSLSTSVHAILHAIDVDPYPVVLAGYSGGAAAVGNAAAEIGRGLHPRLDVRGVALVADPYQPEDVAPGGYGVAGSRPIPGLPTRWLWDARDPIPCTPSLSSLRTIADQSAAMSLADPIAWGADLVDRLRRGRWQPSNWNIFDLIGSFRRTQHDIQLAINYLSGLHVSAYRGAPSAELASWIGGLA